MLSEGYYHLYRVFIAPASYLTIGTVAMIGLISENALPQ